MSDAEYNLQESFYIDNGELDGLTPQQCFVLGYELAQVSAELAQTRTEISKPIHVDNWARVEAAARKRGRTVSITIQSDDWCWLKTTD